MKKWTVGAVDSLRSRDTQNNVDKIICSREYLSCALTIAHSLTNQLSTVEEERGYQEKSPSKHESKNKNDPPMIDGSDKSWSEYISVYCMTKEAIEKDKKKDELGMHNNNNISVGDEGHTSVDADFEPFPYNNSDKLDPGELNNLADQLSTLLEENDGGDQKSIDYLNVRGAILNEGAVEGRPLSNNGKLEIRSLGIAFYELFSGGHLTVAAEAETLGRTAAESEVGGDDELYGNNPSKRRSLQSSSNNLDSLAQVQPSSMVSISVAPLKLLGLPTALCDLISNMIDSVDGDAHDNGGSYGFISEVRDDLKLMIDSPNLYLQDVDLAKAVNVGLQFGRSAYGREAEMQTLKECYERANS